MSSGRVALKIEDDRRRISKAERTLMVLSVTFTLALFGYVAFNAATSPPEAKPEAEVLALETVDGGGVRVQVTLRNAGGVGLIEGTVEVDCAEPAPSVTFTNVPAASERTANLLCPPGTRDVRATVVSFVEA